MMKYEITISRSVTGEIADKKNVLRVYAAAEKEAEKTFMLFDWLIQQSECETIERHKEERPQNGYKFNRYIEKQSYIELTMLAL